MKDKILLEIKKQISESIDNYLRLSKDVEELQLKIGQLEAERQRLEAIDNTDLLQAEYVEVRTQWKVEDTRKN